MPDRSLPSDEQVLANATKKAIQAAGGLEVCERETGISDSQLSRCCSPNRRDSITIRDAATIDAIGHGTDGHPFILNAMARVIGGYVVVQLPEADADQPCLVRTLLDMTTELGDVSRAINDAMCSTSSGGTTVTPGEAVVIREHLDDLDRASARLRQRLDAIAGGEPPK